MAHFGQERFHLSNETESVFLGNRKAVMLECHSSSIQAGDRGLVLNNDLIFFRDLPDEVIEWRCISDVNSSVFR